MFTAFTALLVTDATVLSPPGRLLSPVASTDDVAAAAPCATTAADEDKLPNPPLANEAPAPELAPTELTADLTPLIVALSALPADAATPEANEESEPVTPLTSVLVTPVTPPIVVTDDPALLSDCCTKLVVLLKIDDAALIDPVTPATELFITPVAFETDPVAATNELNVPAAAVAT